MKGPPTHKPTPLPYQTALSKPGEELGAKFEIVPIPDDLKAKAEEYREKLVELVVELDDAVGHLGGFPCVFALFLRRALVGGAHWGEGGREGWRT